MPQQCNGVDCGVFTTMCADFISDDLPLNYHQSEMSHYRLVSQTINQKQDILDINDDDKNLL